jgi:hypothetical protein
LEKGDVAQGTPGFSPVGNALYSMAKEHAQQFLDDLCNNASLRAQYNASGAANADAIMDFALSKGYVFSENDLRQALNDYPEQYVLDQIRDKLKMPRGRPAASTS